MKNEDFVKKLSKAQDYMAAEEYKKALSVLYHLRDIEQKGNFDYSLTHKLYQLISNSESLYKQKAVISIIEDLKKEQDKVSLDTLKEIIGERDDIDLNEGILGREIEILILRGVLPAKIQGNELVFL